MHEINTMYEYVGWSNEVDRSAQNWHPGGAHCRDSQAGKPSEQVEKYLKDSLLQGLVYYQGWSKMF